MHWIFGSPMLSWTRRFGPKAVLRRQLLDAELQWRISGPHSSAPEPCLNQADCSAGLSSEDEAKYRRLVAILRYPLDGESEPSSTDLAALTEADRDRMERCEILASWDRFWRRGQGIPDTNQW